MNDNVSRIGVKNKPKKRVPIKIKQAVNHEFILPSGEMVDSETELLRLLLPMNVKIFYESLSKAVDALCGVRYKHSLEPCVRWGKQNGFIYMGNQKIAVERPRVRCGVTGREVEIPFYKQMQSAENFNRSVFVSALKKCSQRDYKKGLPELAASFGMSKSSVSRSWIKEASKQLDVFMNRDFSQIKLVAVLLDGKRFKSVGCLIALGVDIDGKKHVLGTYECNTEHSESCKSLLDDLERRGLPSRDILFVVDGGSGLNKALREKYDVHRKEKRAVVVRCYVHKWENLKSHLSATHEAEAKTLYWAIRESRDLATAKMCSEQLKVFLKRVNGSALSSYVEAEEELLNLHRLKLSGSLKRFFSSTNPIESLNSLLEEDLRRVKRWHNSEHFRRWIATMILSSESRMKRVYGNLSMPALKAQIESLCSLDNPENIDENHRAA